jgi:hypothetical protein
MTDGAVIINRLKTDSFKKRHYKRSEAIQLLPVYSGLLPASFLAVAMTQSGERRQQNATIWNAPDEK